MKTKIELLAPAKDIEIGMAAIRHGADAVYIGGESFGARFAASNSFSDIEKLANYAHQFHAKVYLTLNTLLYDEEVMPAQKMAFESYNAGVDALIIQDFGLMEVGLPPIPIHASTQMHNFTPERIKFLQSAGFSRVVLPREMSIDTIRKIHETTSIDLEYFIHGALCVSYSGQCYMSACNGGRSANRGSCAQPCRLPYDVLDASKEIIVEQKHILSLKDLNLENQLDKLIEAGVSSLKIEGRLKSMPYVINIVGHYRKLLDKFLNENSNYQKASSGAVNLSFEPNPNKTFNRGYTELNILGRNPEIASIHTPKSMGAFIGKVIGMGQNYIDMDTSETIVNGDGLCFINKKGELTGFVVNKVIHSRIYDDSLDGCFIGAKIFRNRDMEFERLLSNERTRRSISTIFDVHFHEGLTISVEDEDNISVSITFDGKFEQAVQIEKSKQNITEQLSKSGDTIFSVQKVNFLSEKIPFIRISDLNNMRRQLLEALLEKRLKLMPAPLATCIDKESVYPEKTSGAEHNILNSYAKRFYEKHGVSVEKMSAELDNNYNDLPLMTTHHCLRYMFKKCPLLPEKSLNNINDPAFLQYNERLYRLEFDCKNCVMRIFKQDY